MSASTDEREAAIVLTGQAYVTDIQEKEFKKDGDTVKWTAITLYDVGTRKSLDATCTKDCIVGSDVLPALNGMPVPCTITVVLMDKKYKVQEVQLSKVAK